MITLIDGRSGSGKTEFAKALVAGHPDWQLVRLDDIYPGWGGLAAGSAAVPRLLTELRWREWDWVASAPGAWHELDDSRPIVVEGVGAISRASAALADRTIWVEADDDTRKRRALARDPYFAAHWDAWAAQEEQFIEVEHPRELAHEIVVTELSS